MLRSLQIQNYALIQSIHLDFSKSLNVIIGETGAGKSIIIGALQLILGKRADNKVLFKKAEKCVVEGIFTAQGKKIGQLFKEHDLDQEEEEIIIRREINAKGKSRAFINDTPVTLKILSELSTLLIDLHQQFDFLDIHQAEFQMLVVDTLANNQKELSKYQELFKNFQLKNSELNSLKIKTAQANIEKDFNQFQFNELIEAHLISSEQTELENSMNSLNHAEGLKLALNVLINAIDGEQSSITKQIILLSRELIPFTRVIPEIAILDQRLMATFEELNDINQEALRIMEKVEYDPKKIKETEDRLDIIYRLLQKHQKTNVDDLLIIQKALSEKLMAQDNADERITELKKEINYIEVQLKKNSEAIRSKRKKAIPKIQKSISSTLTEMSMPHAKVEIRMEDLQKFGKHGCDKIIFYFSANKGFDYTPLHKAASGGEISRLNLSIKSLIAGKLDLPTLVFDEIDAGISGEIARKMGRLLTKMSNNHQIISITHSPQIAAYGQKHYYVFKKDYKTKIETVIKEIKGNELINEIAKMLSGDPPKDAALANARELIEETIS